MGRSEAELERLAGEVADWLESLDPDDLPPARDAAPLRRVSTIGHEIARLNAELLAAVIDARRDGWSWGHIGMMLGITRQAARQRFRQLVEAEALRAP